MLHEEKMTHKWNCDESKGHKQCDYVTMTGDGILNCVWRIGHPDDLQHEAYYNQPNGPDKSLWMPREQYERMRQVDVLQPWVKGLPLRFQGTLLTAPRGCDDEPKIWQKQGVAFSPGRRLTAFIRFCFMNPADPKEVDYEEGAFFRSQPPDPFKPSEFGHLPQHWYSHAMHALEIIGYYHPVLDTRLKAYSLYEAMVHNMHLNVETQEQQWARLTENRIKKGKVVS